MGWRREGCYCGVEEGGVLLWGGGGRGVIVGWRREGCYCGVEEGGVLLWSGGGRGRFAARNLIMCVGFHRGFFVGEGKKISHKITHANT